MGGGVNRMLVFFKNYVNYVYNVLVNEMLIVCF